MVQTVSRKVIADLVECVLEGGARQATKYLSEKLTVKATAILYGRKPRPRNAAATSLLITVGSPNYVERKFIKDCKAAGEPFPVRKIQLRWPKGVSA